MARRLLVLSALPLFVGASGCQRAARTSPAAIAPDSLVGVVSITGTGFEQQLVLRSASSTTVLSASALDSAALSRMGGIEVQVIGARTGKQFRVDHFTALSVAGSRVVDGVLRDDGGRLVLETSTRRIPLGNPPVALRNLIAARVWIAGPLDTGPNSFGVIVPPR